MFEAYLILLVANYYSLRNSFCFNRMLKETLAASFEEEERNMRASHHESLQQLRDKLRKELEKKEQEIADKHKLVCST